MTLSGRLRLFIVLFFVLIFSFLAVKNASAGPSDCLSGELNCCAYDKRGPLVDPVNCATNSDRYRWYSCEKPTSVVQSCSDVCWVTNGVRGQCLADCPSNVGPKLGGFAQQECCGAGCSFTPAVGGPPGGPVTTVVPGTGGLPTGPIPPIAPGQTFPSWFQQFFGQLLAGFNGGIGLTLGAIPTAIPNGPSPTLGAVPIPIPLSNASQCTVPQISGWSNLVDPNFISQETGDKPCSTNLLASINNGISYIYRECASNNQNQSYCYYDCFDVAHDKRVDCPVMTVPLINYSFGSDRINPPRTIIRLINNFPNAVSLINNSGSGSITITKSNPLKTFISPNSIIIVKFDSDQTIQPNTQITPDTNTFTIDLTNTRAACGPLDLDQLSVEILINNNGSLKRFQKTFICQASFTGIIDMK